ncbi:hypothetical protein [Thalassoglobus polymorphus]|uniref:Uncharacterized protein n=1 Tax=Thalassoglobus polymorphus TaxID=2527994 RepID=A0A517QJW9_9PLAN|nr:hypothetical protein [Thalassoglobus polymorphus]QDT31928.1 hypothetical protein Mal48_11660 [Thalassoglobus polymorphus]
MMKTIFTCLLFSLVTSASAEDFRPNIGPELPSITVKCGEVTILLRQSTQWTPGRIDFRGTPMTTERSAYGTVFRYPEIGFIGTAHLENEPEDLQSLAFFLDGKELTTLQATLQGETFRFVRRSKIRGFILTNIFEIKENRFYETTTVEADVETHLDLVYHFMHAWTPTASELIAGNDATPEEDIHQPLLDDEKFARLFYINRVVDWLSIYEPNSQQFAVSRILSAPKETESISMVWNVPKTYRKYYLKAFQSQKVPKGFAGTWKMVTAFGHEDPGKWQPAAKKLARELRN